MPAPPFLVLENNEKPTGLCIDIWGKIADSLGSSYTFVEKDEQLLLSDLEKHELDLTIIPLTITPERMRKFYFSQPFFITTLSIATNANDNDQVKTFLHNFFSVGFFKIIGLLFFIILVFGFLVWFFEHRKNKKHFRKGIKGLMDGIWWSAVTMTTVGYGDIAPTSFWGRFFATIWMFTAVIIISSFTATISSALTVNSIKNNIDNINDLREVRVATIRGSSSADYLRNNKILFIEYERIEDALNDLSHEKIQAFVYDKAIIEYYLSKKQYQSVLTSIALSANKEYFCFASTNESLIHKINPFLIDVLESTDWNLMLKKYNLGED